MVVIGIYEDSESSASFTYGGLTGAKAALALGTPIDGIIRSIDDTSANIYVHFISEGSEELSKQLHNELAKWDKQSDLLIPYDTGSDKLTLFRTTPRLVRAYIIDSDMHNAKVIDIDSGEIHLRAHIHNLYKIPDESTLRSYAPQAVPVYFKPYAETDLAHQSCLHETLVRVKLQKGDSDSKWFTAEELEASLPNLTSMPLIKGLNKKREFKTKSKKSGTRTTCFSDLSVQNTTAVGPTVATTTPGIAQEGMSHALLTCLIVGSLILVIIIITFVAMYLYKRFGAQISERHRRAHHGHRRHRGESQQNSDGNSPSSSQKRDPLPVPVEGAPLPLAPLPLASTPNVISSLPQYNIGKESAHHTQVTRIFPMVAENSHSPNRAMTPLKTAEMRSAQTQTGSATRSEPLHDDELSSNVAQDSGSRMAAGSSSDLSSAPTLQPPSHHTYTLKSTRLPSASSSFEIAAPPPPRRRSPIQEKTRTSSDATTRGATATSSDWKTSFTAPPTTMASNVVSGESSEEESDDDEDDGSITPSVDDCERVLAAYKPSPTASAPVPIIAAHRTKSHHSTRPLHSFISGGSVTHPYTDNESAIKSSPSPHGPRLMSLPERTSHREQKEKRRTEYQPRQQQQDLSNISIPSDLLTPYTLDTLSPLHTAVSRRDSTVSWLADRTQSSMGRSMNDFIVSESDL